MKTRFLFNLLCLLLFGAAANAQVITLESLLQEMTDPGRLAQYPAPEFQSLQASSYNRQSVATDQPGWFADSDGLGFIRIEENKGKKEWVVMEHTGPGCITRMWTPYFYYSLNNRKGPNIRIYLDGGKKPVIDECFIDLLTGKGSVKPPFASLTARAGVCFLPIPFAKSCKITMTDRSFYNIINYRAYADGTKVRTFSRKQYTDAASQLDQTAGILMAKPQASGLAVSANKISIKPGDSHLTTLPDGNHAVREFRIRIDPASGAQALRSTILEMTFDGIPAAWCPVGDFFCSPDKINPFQTWNRTVLPDGTMVCRYVMPYAESGRIRLINLQDKPLTVWLDIKTDDWKWDDRSMHFYSAWKPVGTLPGDKFVDLNFIDIKGKGVIAGDALTVLSPGHGWWGEGDEKIFIDEADINRKFPSHFGTGTEDYYGWAGGVVPTGRDTFSIPIGSNVCNGNPADPSGYNICTRNRILDAITFTNRLKFDMEASPGTDIREPWNLLDYSLVTFWYALPGSTSNAVPESQKASRPPLTLEEIDRMQDFRKNGTVVLSPIIPYLPKEVKANPGQFAVFQIGVKADITDLNDIRIEFSDLNRQPKTDNKYPPLPPFDQRGERAGLTITTQNPQLIPASRMTCFNSGGIDFMGRPFSKRIDIPAGKNQDLWIGIDLDGISDGVYEGMVVISSGTKAQKVPVKLTVEGEVVPNHGYDQGKSLARLNWLNSTIGIDDKITKGYLPVKISGNRISILGRSMEIAENGLPKAVTTFFGPSNQQLKDQGEPLINSPFRFIIEKENGEIIRLKPEKLNITGQSESKVTWTVINSSPEIDLECTGQMEFDGFVDYSLKLTAKSPIKVKDIRLEIPMNKAKAEYMMGLNHEGGYRAPIWKWKWDVTKNQDMLWVGAVNGGMRIKWKAANYRRPLINIYYEYGRLNMPPSWWNEGKGGVNIGPKNTDILINAYSGPREIKSGEILDYDFELLLTPFRVINKDVQFGDRYYHGGGTNTSVKVEAARAAGANIINIHHAEDIYPYINYPYLDENVPELKNLFAQAHQAGMRMKIYYTTREFTKNQPEFMAFYSLNGEIIYPGPGDSVKTILNPDGPDEWFRKNLDGKYIPAWHNLINEGKFKGETDLSIITTPDSRLNNFYIAGLDWMVRNIGIDGVYIDDSALDRFTLMRARKIIDRYRPEGRMDLHSWNHFNGWAGFTNCLNLYMDLLPYFDLCWIGEGRDYNRMPDHWLIEVSGIPFGIPGQMLEGGGNPWRGMVYCITNRAGWTPNPPKEIWKFWDEYQLKEKEMIGYWDKNCPVTCSNPMIKATIYKGKGMSVIAVANWSDKDQPAGISVNWSKLGMDPAKATVEIPAVKDFQAGQKVVSLSKMVIPGGRGYLVVVTY